MKVFKAIDCYNKREDFGAVIESLQIGNDTEHTMSDKYYPNGDEGLVVWVC